MGFSTADTAQSREPTDEELVTAAQVALPAFEHLYRRYVNDVYRFNLRRLGSENDAADATSIVFTRALTNIKNCQPASFRPWLFTIARNVVIDHYRAVAPAEDLEVAANVADRADGPEAVAIQHEQREFVDRLLPRLTGDQRSIIELRLAGLSANEIASVLGKSRNAIDQAQFRAVTKLRDLLAPPQIAMEETS